jgi:hypothetical protein
MLRKWPLAAGRGSVLLGSGQDGSLGSHRSVVQTDTAGDDVDRVQDRGGGAADGSGDRFRVGVGAGGGGGPSGDIPDVGLGGVQSEEIGEDVGSSVGLDFCGAAVVSAGRIARSDSLLAVRGSLWSKHLGSRLRPTFSAGAA